MPEELGDYADLNEIFAESPEGTEVKAPAAETTPDPELTEDAATDGGKTSEEATTDDLPAALKDDEEKSDEAESKETPDLTPSAEFKAYLDKHPELKAHYTAELSRMEKGVQQWITKQGTELKTLTAQSEEWKPVVDKFSEARMDANMAVQAVDYYARFSQGASEAQAAYAELGTALNQAYGAGFTSAPAGQATEPAEGEGPKSKYGFEFASDDKVVDTVLSLVERQISPKLDKVLGFVQNQETASQVQAKASAETPAIQREYGSWVKPDMVTEAVKAYPNLSPMEAFGAKFAREIARQSHRLGTERAPTKNGVRNMPGVGVQTGGETAAVDYGADLMDIWKAEQTA